MELTKMESSSPYICNGDVLVNATNAVAEEIPASIRYIQNGTDVEYVFKSSQQTLEKVSFKEGSLLEYIGEFAFYSCSLLEEIDLSNCNHCTTLGSFCFAMCSSVKTLILPSSLTTIYGHALRGIHIHMTLNLTSYSAVNQDAFTNSTFSFSCSESSKYRKEYENNIYSLEFTHLMHVSFSTKKLVLHPKTTNIGLCAFTTTSMEEIILPNQINSIDTYGFHLNDYIKKIVLSQNMTTIPTDMILALPSLEVLYIPEGITQISEDAIGLCDSMKYMHIPSTLENISSNSIKLPSLKYVTYEKWQYDNLINAGVPQRALHLYQSACSQQPIAIRYIFLMAIFL